LKFLKFKIFKIQNFQNFKIFKYILISSSFMEKLLRSWFTYSQSSNREKLMLEESRKRKECRKRKTLNPRHYFPCVFLSMSCLPLSARFLCEGTLLRACVISIRCVLHPRKKVAHVSTSTGECRERLIVLFVNRKKKLHTLIFFILLL